MKATGFSHDKWGNEIVFSVLQQRMDEHSERQSASDKLTFKEFFRTMPLIQRGQPLMDEMIRVLSGREDAGGHEQILPNYCQNIFDVFQKTFFKSFPMLSETVLVTDQARLTSAKTVEEPKKGIRVEWKNIGIAFGIMLRCVRFGDLEAEKGLERDGLGELSPAENKEIFMIVFGEKWLEENEAKIATQNPVVFFTGLLQQFVEAHIAKISGGQTNLSLAAYQWSPAAVAEFLDGMAEGMNGFMDGDGRLSGESGRAGIYSFLLIAWPEIKDMIESNPRTTLRDLHEWLKPFMRRDMIANIDIEALRDVCEPPPKGIGLGLRPLKARSAN
jgi:hypothetical protein